MNLQTIPVLLLIVSGFLLLLFLGWRYTLLGLALQYIGVFWLLVQILPVGLAAVKLIVGWMAGAILASSQVSLGEELPVTDLSGRIFRGLVLIFGVIVAFSILPAAEGWIPVEGSVLVGGLILLISGLLQLGLTGNPFRLSAGLLTFLAGFEMIYAGLVSSVLVVGLLGLINLGLGLAGSYFILSSTLEESS
ncbi:MAG: hypothetical protein AB1457_11520 [Chloroflexota bacterium]|nr:MAG: hypothetical protein KatS3mg047_0297 [Bellilinea sp.]